MFRPRTLAPVLRSAAKTFPALIVTGPRQSGKTTLVRELFGATHRYCTLDDPAVREQALRDPRLLLDRFAPPLILDEIQYAPQLLHYVKLDIDAHRTHSGRYVITGSQAFSLMQGVSESLAGRAAITSLLSFSLREALGVADTATDWRAALSSGAPMPDELSGVLSLVQRGGYPEPALQSEIDVKLWHASYVQTYLERDVRSLRAVGDLNDFQRQLFATAARTGSLINYEDLARDLGITGKTVRAWMSVLEASGQVLTLKPFFGNVNKRLVKRPKIYFLDTGTLAYLLGVSQPEQLLQGAVAGPLFEAAVLGQIHRLLIHHGEASRLCFWRTAAGHEVDFVIEDGQRVIPIEAKLTATPTPRDAAAIEAFQALFPQRAAKGLVVCLCRERFPLTRSVDAVPLGAF